MIVAFTSPRVLCVQRLESSSAPSGRSESTVVDQASFERQTGGVCRRMGGYVISPPGKFQGILKWGGGGQIYIQILKNRNNYTLSWGGGCHVSIGGVYPLERGFTNIPAPLL